MVKYRKESDSFGFINVPSNAYWGAQTQRSLKNFDIGNETIPLSMANWFWNSIKYECQ